jgi:hypothetical protein
LFPAAQTINIAYKTGSKLWIDGEYGCEKKNRMYIGGILVIEMSGIKKKEQVTSLFRIPVDVIFDI